MVHKIKTRQNRATPEHLNLYHQHNEKSKLSNLDNNPTRVLISKYIVYIYFIDRSRVHRYGLIILCRVTGYRVYAPPPLFRNHRGMKRVTNHALFLIKWRLIVLNGS